GDSIEASIPTQHLDRFMTQLVENSVYYLTYFRVEVNFNDTLATFNPHKIIFIEKTEVATTESSLIHRYGLTLMPANEIMNCNAGSNHLVDVVGVVTAMHQEFNVDLGGCFNSVLNIELTDLSGKLEVALYGFFIDEFQKMFSDCF
ncbi:replication factor A protein, partial [Trifolium medium]|nr:replication factor A protein [Trifolium medium]